MSAPVLSPPGLEVPAAAGSLDPTSTATRVERARRARLLARIAAAAVLVGCVVLALAPLLAVFTTGPLVRVVVAGSLLGALLAGLAAWRRWSAALTLAVAVVGHLVGGTLAVAPPGGAGFVQVGGVDGVLRALLGGVITSWKDVLTLVPPLGEVPGVLVAPWLLAYVGAALTVTVSLRASRGRAAAGLVPVVVLVLALVLADARAVLPAAIGILVGLGGLLSGAVLRGTVRRPGGAVAMVLVAALAGAGLVWAIAPQHRLVVRESVEPPFDPAAFESPLATFRAFVKTDDGVELTISGDLAGAPLRLAVMDAYDGVVWSTSVSDRAGGAGGSGSGEFRRVPGELPVPDAGAPVSVEVTTVGFTGVWLPTVGDVRTVTSPDVALRDGLRYNLATSSAVVLGGLGEGDGYTLVAVVPPGVDDADLAGVPAADVELGPLMRVPDVVGVVAREWVGTAGSPIEMARALEQRLAGSGWYSDGLEEGAPAGHGADRMTALLEADQMIGNAEQYASAMALMARSLGLPARVVMGFTPELGGAAGVDAGTGSSGAAGADGTIEVLGSDVDAWVEIAFEGHGWVPFYPTPDKSRTPDPSQIVTDPETQPQVTQPRPTQPPPAEAPTPETNDVRPAPEPEPDPEPEGSSVWPVVAIAGGGLLLLVTPFLAIVALKAARRRRRRRAADARLRSQGAWAELVAVARDAGQPVTTMQTRSEGALALAQVVAAHGVVAAQPGVSPTVVPPRERGVAGEVAAAAGYVAAVADAAQFAPSPPPSHAVDGAWEAYVAARSGLLGALTPWRRLRARLSTASLRRPRRPRR